MIKQTLLFLLVFSLTACQSSKEISRKINRYELVNRHNIRVEQPDSMASLSVGNGEFCFTTDITGLQTFPEFYEKGIPLGTQSNWGWHSLKNTENYKIEEVLKLFNVGDRKVPYVYRYNEKGTRQKAASEWLRENPHRLHLGLIGLAFETDDSNAVTIQDLKNPIHTLNLWTGAVTSEFEWNGKKVQVEVYNNQDIDMISASIKSPLIKEKKLKVKITFPYSSTVQTCTGYDLSNDDKHTTQYTQKDNNEATFKRKLDNDDYFVRLKWQQNAAIEQTDTHCFVLSGDENALEFSCLFTDRESEISLPTFEETQQNSISSYKKFWESGGAIDFSECKDNRANELERRIVLSQYLTKIQSSGSLPPQETGLTYNSWYGKFHLEMHWWHSWHFIAWGRPELMKQQIEYYRNVYDKAEQTAKNQGYEGVRWQKMTDPYGNESPSSIASLLIWQQPHLIYFAEMLYLQDNDEKILDEYKNLVFATADFMASYARWDEEKQHYVLGPALIPAQELFDAKTTINPAFEVTYWYWALQTAQEWRNRLGMEKNPKYQEVLDKLSPLSISDSMYLFTENSVNSYVDSFYWHDHPIVLGIYGFLPRTPLVNDSIFANSLDKVIDIWQWDKTWGWDYPLSAMAAARLQKPELAFDLLLMKEQKNIYLVNGHNYQDKRLRLYMPGNGGILAAIAIMCDEAEKHDDYIGLSRDGNWEATWEGMGKLP